MDKAKTRIIFLSLIVLILAACGSKTVKGERTTASHTTIKIQPYNNVTHEDAQRLVEKLRPHLDSLFDTHVEYEVMPVEMLPDSIRIGGKYDAKAILKQERSSRCDAIVIGFTHDDIATEAHGYKNWGVFGLAFKGGNVAVVSDRRLKDKNDLWKVAEHEFIHAYFNYGHCPEDDRHCIMCDAHGGNPIPYEEKVCSTCMERLHGIAR